MKEHREALLTPNWKQRPNYETDWMARDDMVRATYDGDLGLVELTSAYGLLDRGKVEEIEQHILRAKELLRRMEESTEIDDSLRQEIIWLNPIESLCDRHEKEWPVMGSTLKLLNVFRLVFNRRPCSGPDKRDAEGPATV